MGFRPHASWISGLMPHPTPTWPHVDPQETRLRQMGAEILTVDNTYNPTGEWAHTRVLLCSVWCLV